MPTPDISGCMTPEQARAVERRSIEIGTKYAFYCEVQEEYKPAAERLRNYTGQEVTVVSIIAADDPDSSALYLVRASDGREFEAHQEELDDWDRDLGQFFWADGTYGPNHDPSFLVNERTNHAAH